MAISLIHKIRKDTTEMKWGTEISLICKAARQTERADWAAVRLSSGQAALRTNHAFHSTLLTSSPREKCNWKREFGDRDIHSEE